jgi:hypothetical protein
MVSYTYIQIIYGILLLALTITVGVLYWKQTRYMYIEPFQAANEGSTYIFYHIFCNDKTEAVVKDQVTKIVFSQTYPLIKTVYCFLTGEQTHIETIKSLLSNYASKFQVAAVGPGDTSYERFTLLKIKEYIKGEDKFLYIHSKGVSNINTQATYMWRNYMEYFLLTNASKCIELLNTHDIVGTAYSTYAIGPHYSGNFWWSTGKYYLSLPATIGAGYTDPEAYIFVGKPKHIVLDKDRFNSVPQGQDLNLYKNIIYPKDYL